MPNITCGNCKGSHETPAMVRDCYNAVSDRLMSLAEQAVQQGSGELGSALAAQAAARTDAPTEKQLAFAHKLAAERPVFCDVMNYHHDVLDRLSRREISQVIDELLKQPIEAKAPVVELEDGVYEKDGEYFKVYHTVHGANQQVAKRLMLESLVPGVHKGEWEYEGKKPLHKLAPENKLEGERAKQFGLIYGFCVNCATCITREESLHVGYGPTCAKNNSWWYPTKKQLRALVSGEGIEIVGGAA